MSDLQDLALRIPLPAPESAYLRDDGYVWLARHGFVVRAPQGDALALRVGGMLAVGYSADELRAHVRGCLPASEGDEPEETLAPLLPVEPEPALPTVRRSRPRMEKRTTVLKVRLAPSELKLWEERAARKGLPLAQLVRREFQERVDYERAPR